MQSSEQLENNNSPSEVIPSELVACSICSRKFLPDRLVKHVEICEKQKRRKRNIFDSSKQRAPVDEKGDLLVPSLSSSIKNSSPSKSKGGKGNGSKKMIESDPGIDDKSTSRSSNWRDQHEQFIRTIREARGVKMEPEPLEEDGKKKIPPGYVECPCCSRRFSKAAGDRHIPWCKEQKSRSIRSPKVNNLNHQNGSKGTVNKVKGIRKYHPEGLSKTDIESDSNGGDLIIQGVGSSPSSSSSTTGEINSNGKLFSPRVKKKTIAGGSRYRSPPRKDNQSNSSLVNGGGANGINSNSNHVNHNYSNSNNTPSRVKTRWKAEDGQSKQHPKTPVMKFKEKFPNHVRSSLDSITTKFLANTENPAEILRKPENFTGPMIPKTVPGVRTRGLSPMRGENGQLSMESQDLIRMKGKGDSGGSFADERLKLFDRLILNNGNGAVDENNRNSTSGSSESGSSRPSHESIDSSSELILPRFCHQCGTKYSTQSAKYCHECGSRRLGSGGPFLLQH
ncbi:zinc finger C2HC domain-containing protein 1A-like isoform X2 [Panonychus citri]|uniref:zinc finger C2HC domain-containing protein 1A-like isoform X2 n=1 Tax=Panonychus citri TaxID=50023 RepID=UPI002307C97B|nr:zinc finger C2HC domain-containing protein 1A-like isoform X2 [Panonychus citri]